MIVLVQCREDRVRRGRGREGGIYGGGRERQGGGKEKNEGERERETLRKGGGGGERNMGWVGCGKIE